MTEFEPLRETSASPFERALLRSVDHDVPSQRAFTKTAAALGVGGALLGTAGNTAAAAGGTAAVATLWAVAIKPLLIGAVGGLVVAVGSHRLSAPHEPTKPAPSVVVERAPAANAPAADVPGVHAAFPETAHAGETVPAPRETPPRESETSPLAPRSSNSRAPSPKPSPEASPPPAPAPVASANPPVAAPTSAPTGSVSIASEVANVDRARQALREGRAADALHELDVYRVAWPSGVLATEAAVLRIEAHLALGDRTSGIRAARAFLAATPSGRYAARVRALFKPAELE